MPKPSLLILLGCLLPIAAIAQQAQPYLSRYATAGTADGRIEVSIFNPGAEIIDLEGYILVGRHFIAPLPRGTQIPPYASLHFSSESRTDVILLSSLPEYQSRPGNPEIGDYIALVAPRSFNLLDGLYLANQAEVQFLPDGVPFRGNTLRLPPESHPQWGFMADAPDPVFAYVRINGQWEPNSRRTNYYDATEYNLIQAQSTSEGAVLVKWKTRYERDCLFHRLERSVDGQEYLEVARFAGRRDAESMTDYQYYDRSVRPDTSYWYRVRHVDKFGNQVFSDPTFVSTAPSQGGFLFDVEQSGTQGGQFVQVRYSSKESMQVRLKLFDGRMRQVETLGSGWIEPNRDYLVTYRQALEPGEYYLLIETDRQRYHDVLIVE